MYSLLMPAQDPLSDRAFEFQLGVVRSGRANVVLDMLREPNFLATADMPTKRY
jgi:ubiquitin carboxyl-terminal hydrolase 9/24